MEVLEKVESVCPECLHEDKVNKIEAQIVKEEGKIWIKKKCSEHGEFKAIYFSDPELYKRWKKYKVTGDEVEGVRTFGLYDTHLSQTILTNLLVTNRCNLRCSYCFMNAGASGHVYEPSLEELKEMMKQARNQKPMGSKALQLSVDSEEKVLLRNKKGEVVYKEIGSFVDKNMNNPRKVNSPIQHERQKISGWEVLSLDEATNSCFKPIKEIIRHPVKGDLFEIITENGNRIRTTGNHSIFVFDGEKLTTKSVSDLSKGDQLVKSLCVPKTKKIQKINLLKKLKGSPHEKKIRIYPKDKKEVEKIIGRRIGKTVGLHEIKNNLEELDFEKIAYFNSKKEKTISSKIKITPELARLVGYYMGEGCCYKSGIIFTFGGEEKELVEDCIKCLRKLFGKTNIRKKCAHRGSALQIYIEGYLYKLFFDYILEAGYRSKEKKVPQFLYNVSDSIKKEFLETYFRCDGNVRIRKSGCEIDYNTASRKLANDLIILHQQLGLAPRIAVSTSKGHLNKVTNNFVRESKKYKLILGGKKQLFNSLWLLNKEEKKKFEKYLDNKENHSPKRMRIDANIDELWDNRKEMRNLSLKRLLKRAHFDKSISKENLAYITEALKKEGISFNPILNDISHGDLGFVKVKEINKVKPSSNYVYDLSVDGEQFFSGLGLLLAHNTGGEPTIREDLFEIIEMAKDLGFTHIQLNTNGIKLAEDPEYCKKIRELGVNTVYLSFDGVTKETNPWIEEDKKAIENLRKAGLCAVLVPTIIKNKNLKEVGDIVKFALDNLDIIRGVNFQPISFCGRASAQEIEEGRVDYGALFEEIEESFDGKISKEDFYPVPFVNPISKVVENLTGEKQVEFTANPGCGGATYLFKKEEGIIPITRFMDVEGFVEFIKGLSEKKGFLKRIKTVSSFLRNSSKFIDEEKAPEGMNLNKMIADAIIKGDYKSLGDFHYSGLFVGTMWFQDGYNLNIDRLKRCVIHYTTPEGIVPFCAYNGMGIGGEIRKKHSIPVEEWEKETGNKLKEDLWEKGPLS